MTRKVGEVHLSQTSKAMLSRRTWLARGEGTLLAAVAAAIAHLELDLKNGVERVCGSAQEGVRMELTERLSSGGQARPDPGSSHGGGKKLQRRWCDAMVRGQTASQLVGRVPSPSHVLFPCLAHRNCVRAEAGGWKKACFQACYPLRALLRPSSNATWRMGLQIG